MRVFFGKLPKISGTCGEKRVFFRENDEKYACFLKKTVILEKQRNGIIRTFVAGTKDAPQRGSDPGLVRSAGPAGRQLSG